MAVRVRVSITIYSNSPGTLPKIETSFVIFVLKIILINQFKMFEYY